MVQGRALTVADSQPGAAPVAVMGNRMWHRLFGAAPEVVGREITVDEEPVTIVGVTPPSFYASFGWRQVDVALAMATPAVSSAQTAETDEGRCQPILRLRDNVSDAQAQAEIALLMQPFVADQPPPFGARPASRIAVQVKHFGRGIDELDGRRISNEAASIAAVSFLFATMLLIPCANIAAIMLARTITRRREITTRLAIGAWRGRIVRQLLTEGLLLSSIAGVLGVLLSHILFLVLRDPGGGT